MWVSTNPSRNRLPFMLSGISETRPVGTPKIFAIKKWLPSCSNIPGKNSSENKATVISGRRVINKKTVWISWCNARWSKRSGPSNSKSHKIPSKVFNGEGKKAIIGQLGSNHPITRKRIHLSSRFCNFNKRFRFQTGSTNQGTIDIRLTEKVCSIFRFD